MKSFFVSNKVDYVNFTWKSGENKKYYYHFDRLQSFNEDILQSPTISVEIRGRVPRKPKGKKPPPMRIIFCRRTRAFNEALKQ